MTAINFHYLTDHRISSFLPALGPRGSSERGRRTHRNGASQHSHPPAQPSVQGASPRPWPWKGSQAGVDWMALQKEAAVGPLEHLVPRRVPEVWTGVRDVAPVPTANDCLSPTSTCRVSELLACLGIRHLLPPALVFAPAQRAPLEGAALRQCALRSRCFVGSPCMSPRTAPG